MKMEPTLTRYPSLLNIKGVIAQPALVRLPAWPRTWTAAWPMPNWFWVPGMVQDEEGIVSMVDERWEITEVVDGE